MAQYTRSGIDTSSPHPLAAAGEVGGAPWLGPQWADLVCLPAPSSPAQPDQRRRQPSATEQPDEEVSSYDDLFVSVGPAGRLLLDCPACGSIPIPLRQTTLSDLTNAAIDHLGEKHPYTLTLPSRRSAAPRTDKPASFQDASSGYFTDRFWSLVGLLSEEGAGIEALARALASSSRNEIVTFQEQLRNAAALLDTPAHRTQKIRDLDDPLQTAPAAISDDAFYQVSASVVARGRDAWLGVLADPSHLAGSWSLQAGRALLDAPESALNRTTPAPPVHVSSRSRTPAVA